MVNIPPTGNFVIRFHRNERRVLLDAALEHVRAARGKWAEMPALISDEMLEAFVTQAETPAGLASALRHRYHTLADRLTLYTPFVPGEKDAWWQELLRHMAEA